MIVANLVTVSPMRSAAENDPTVADRRTLVRWMSGRWEGGVDDALDAAELESMKALAWSEGVAVLVGEQLARSASVPAAVRQLCQDWTRGQSAAELGRRARLKAVLACLDRAGVEVLVLKGTALGHWLYPAPSMRESSDVDLLFADRAEALRAAEALAPLGYTMPYQPARFRHELLCRSADGTLDLDLHWDLSDWPVLAALPDFAALHGASIPLPGLGATARGLGGAHALLHACVHRASNLSAAIGDRLKWLYDLHLLAAVLDEAGWAGFVRDAARAQACGICAEGLAASAGWFATQVPADVKRALDECRASEPLDASRLADWRYVQRRNFEALPGWGDRLAWLWSRLLPSAGHMRELYGQDHGRLALFGRRLRRAAARLMGRD